MEGGKVKKRNPNSERGGSVFDFGILILKKQFDLPIVSVETTKTTTNLIKYFINS